MQCLPPNTLSEFSTKKAPFLKRLRFKRAPNNELPSAKRTTAGSNPTSYPKTAFGIYGFFNKKSGSKNPESFDAVGFAPTASKVLEYYGAGGGTRTHTMLPSADFESATSTIPSHRHLRCPVYNIRSSFSSYIFSVTKFL